MMQSAENLVANIAKRDRSTNFTPPEVRLLMEVVCKFRQIIENKKTDAITNKDKEAAWIKIAALFNAASGVKPRTAKTLKLKYEGVKKSTKKKAATNRQEIYRTGGGEASQVPFSDVEEKVLAICTNISGLEARNDSDAIIESTSTSSMQGEPLFMKFDEDPLNDSDAVTESTYTMEGETSINFEVVEDALNASSTVLPIGSEKWQTWTPKALKSRVTPILRKKVPKASMASNFEELCKARLEVVDLQRQISNKELEYHELRIKQKREEHEVRMLHLLNEEERRREEHNLKLQCYNK